MYSFRFKFQLDSGLYLVSDEHEVLLTDSPSEKVVFRAELTGQAIEESRVLVVRGDRYVDESSAWTAYWRWSAAVKLSFAKHGIGADFGAQPYGQVDERGNVIEDVEWGTGGRVIADDHIPMVFRTEPMASFSSVSAVNAMKGVYAEEVLKAMREEAATERAPLPRNVHLALDLFGRAQGLGMPEAKLVMLVTAVEAVIESAPRADEVVAVVKAANAAIRKSDLPADMKSKLGSEVGRAKNKSITESGKELFESKSVWSPEGESAGDFWVRCYKLRSAIVHGTETTDDAAEISVRAAQAELVVGSLLHALSID